MSTTTTTLRNAGLFTLGTLAAAMAGAATSLESGPVFQGELEFETAGTSVSGIGDLNGDGIDDYLIGAPRHVTYPGPVSTGNAYVIFGSAAGIPDQLSPSGLNGLNGFRISGLDIGDQLGHRVAGVGDVNGDGLPDLALSAIGAHGAEASSGQVYVLYGTERYPADVNVRELNGLNGITIDGPLDTRFTARMGHSLSGGDLNGDGYQDIAIGAPYFSPEGVHGKGSVWVVQGGPALPARIALQSVTAGVTRIDGPMPSDTAGWTVSFAGDANADGYQDLLIGVPRSDTAGDRDRGTAYLVYGQREPGPVIRLSELTTGRGVRFEGMPRPEGALFGERFGSSVAAAGDVNGDGNTDFLFGAPSSTIDGGMLAGSAYLVYGENPMPPMVAMSGNERVVRFTGTTQDQAGSSVAAADLNGDGLTDLAIGAPTADPTIDTLNGAGETYVVFGRRDALPSRVVLKSLEDAGLGLVLQGTIRSEQSGSAVAFAGDLNRDGYRDLLIGAPARTTQLFTERRRGAVYVFKGSKQGAQEPGCDHELEDALALLQRIMEQLEGAGVDKLDNKLRALRHQLEAGNLNGAIQKLTHDLLAGDTIDRLCTGPAESKGGSMPPPAFCAQVRLDLESLLEILLCLNG